MSRVRWTPLADPAQLAHVESHRRADSSLTAPVAIRAAYEAGAFATLQSPFSNDRSQRPHAHSAPTVDLEHEWRVRAGLSLIPGKPSPVRIQRALDRSQRLPIRLQRSRVRARCATGRSQHSSAGSRRGLDRSHCGAVRSRRGVIRSQSTADRLQVAHEEDLLPAKAYHRAFGAKHRGWLSTRSASDRCQGPKNRVPRASRREQRAAHATRSAAEPEQIEWKECHQVVNASHRGAHATRTLSHPTRGVGVGEQPGRRACQPASVRHQTSGESTQVRRIEEHVAWQE